MIGVDDRRCILVVLSCLILCSSNYVHSFVVAGNDSSVLVDDDDDIDDLLDLDILEEVLASARPVNESIAIDDKPSLNVTAAPSNSTNTSAAGDASDPVDEIIVKSNLESMTDQELAKLCEQRGFDITPDVNGKPLTHDDYVAAAKRCLSLEDEMNAIIAKNPELAAELDSEIERMRLEKERLEKEREVLLAEKEALEAKLAKENERRSTSNSSSTGVFGTRKPRDNADDKTLGSSPTTDTVASIRGGGSRSFESKEKSNEGTENVTSNSSSSNHSAAAHVDLESVEGVLRESFVQLFDRVGRDLRLVGSALRMVAFRPMGSAVQVAWRYASPTVEGLVTKAYAAVAAIVGMESVSVMLQAMSRHWQTATNVGGPLLVSLRDVVRSTIIEPLSRRPEVRKVALLVESFVGPLCDSLWSGWKSMEPDLICFTNNATIWLQQVISENDAEQQGQRRRRV